MELQLQRNGNGPITSYNVVPSVFVRISHRGEKICNIQAGVRQKCLSITYTFVSLLRTARSISRVAQFNSLVGSSPNAAQTCTTQYCELQWQPPKRLKILRVTGYIDCSV